MIHMMKKNELVTLNILEPKNGHALLDLIQIVSHVGVQSNLAPVQIWKHGIDKVRFGR